MIVLILLVFIIAPIVLIKVGYDSRRINRHLNEYYDDRQKKP